MKYLIIALGFLMFNTSVLSAQDSTIAVPDTSARSVIPAPDSLSSSLDYDSLIGFAKNLLGVPYKAAGKNPSGFDCSGFTHYCYKNFGVSLPHSSYEQCNVGTEVSVENARPGDLIFFKGRNIGDKKPHHVGIVTENNNGSIQFIHASCNHGIKLEALLNNSYYQPRFLKIKRLH